MSVFPKNEKSLDETFKKAQTPEPDEFIGAYFVDMLTRVPSFRKFNHRKIFYAEPKRQGHNAMFKNFTWGRFFLEKSVYNGLNTVLINYRMPENTIFSNRVRDHVRRVEKDTYLGRFHVFLGGKLRFLGYFSLLKD